MSFQITLLTAHKGVDLHAATAVRVMRDRLTGGESLEGLYRCQWHGFTRETIPSDVSTLLETGRFYNPNKHHYGIFAWSGGLAQELAAARQVLPTDWPGSVLNSDLDPGPDLYQRLLGGEVPTGRTAVDIATFVREQCGPVIAGVLWRLVLNIGRDHAADLACRLAVARSRTEGLLLNPHLEDWLLAVR